MVVAHPDDESLWGAGLLLRYPKNWQVICCTVPDRDPIRAELFQDACAVLGVRGRVINQREDESLKFGELNIEGADLVVTHNNAGEYGHRHHKEVHEYLTVLCPEKVICFGYRPKGNPISDFVIELTPDECARKMAAIQCYNNIGSSGRPTWTMLMDAFAHKFNLWREPFEKFA